MLVNSDSRHLPQSFFARCHATWGGKTANVGYQVLLNVEEVSYQRALSRAHVCHEPVLPILYRPAQKVAWHRFQLSVVPPPGYSSAWVDFELCSGHRQRGRGPRCCSRRCVRVLHLRWFGIWKLRDQWTGTRSRGNPFLRTLDARSRSVGSTTGWLTRRCCHGLAYTGNQR